MYIYTLNAIPVLYVRLYHDTEHSDVTSTL